MMFTAMQAMLEYVSCLSDVHRFVHPVFLCVQAVPKPIAMEPCWGSRAGVLTVLLYLPRVPSGIPPPGQSGMIHTNTHEQTISCLRSMKSHIFVNHRFRKKLVHTICDGFYKLEPLSAAQRRLGKKRLRMQRARLLVCLAVDSRRLSCKTGTGGLNTSRCFVVRVHLTETIPKTFIYSKTFHRKRLSLSSHCLMSKALNIQIHPEMFDAQTIRRLSENDSLRASDLSAYEAKAVNTTGFPDKENEQSRRKIKHFACKRFFFVKREGASRRSLLRRGNGYCGLIGRSGKLSSLAAFEALSRSVVCMVIQESVTFKKNPRINTGDDRGSPHRVGQQSSIDVSVYEREATAGEPRPPLDGRHFKRNPR
ncbi:Attractin-like protein 1 [Collichthys lucidus]|uniref:Attractin-like protein 1 n=1 Tax=Collichthys lucidus TaxID=240159 RepID=A0A4U5VDE6_COLLU|nr:Attractin-like protein 1 [Collichthys lucidus]